MRQNPLLIKAIDTANTLLEILKDKDIETDFFPRNMVRFAIDGMEIPVVYRSTLSINKARKYVCLLHGSNFEADLEDTDRELYGLLHIGPPSNLILIRAGLPQHIVNFIIAHELGHFLADIFWVSHLWQKALPEQRLEIINAFAWKNFDPKLELRALIKGLPQRPYEIAGHNQENLEVIIDREILADLIARELIAPWRYAVGYYRNQPPIVFARELHTAFGLPLKIAHGYHDDIRQSVSPRRDFVDKLFSPLLRSKKHQS